MNKKQITRRAKELESALNALRHMHFTSRDDSGLKNSEKHTLWLLATLNDGQAVTASEVANKLRVTLAAITHHINSLQEQGYVTRSSSPTDRRVVLVSLSEKGTEMIGAIKKSYWKKICGLVEHLGDRDSSELVALITKIADYSKKTADL